MRRGIVSQAVYERSIERPLEAAGVFSGGAGHCLDLPGRILAVHSTASGAADGFCLPGAEMIFDEAVNRLDEAPVYSPGRMAEPAAGFPAEGETGYGLAEVSVSALLPPDMEEEDLKKLVRRLGQEAKKAGAEVEAFSAAVSESVMNPVISAAAGRIWTPEMTASLMQSEGIGGAAAEARGKSGSTDDRMPEGCDLLMAGPCGAAGTAVLLRSFPERLSGQFPAGFLKGAERMGEKLLTEKAAALIRAEEKDAQLQCIGEGGVFSALWTLCGRLSCGMDADIHLIPIRQETIEICEALNRNPYRLYGTGGLLAVVRNGEAVLRKLEREGLEAAVIGKLTKGPGRYIRNRDITRCLEKPQCDALFEEG